MPSNKIHSEFCEQVFGKPYEDVNTWIDEAHLYLNRFHRIKRHTPNMALLDETYEHFIKAGIYPQEEWENLQLVVRLHIAFDTIDSGRIEDIKKDKIIMSQQGSRIKTLEEVCQKQKIETDNLYTEKYRRICEPCLGCTLKDEADKTLAFDQELLRETKVLYSKFVGGASFFSDIISRLKAESAFWALIAAYNHRIAMYLLEREKGMPLSFLSTLKEYTIVKIIWKSRSDGAIRETKPLANTVEVVDDLIHSMQNTEQLLINTLGYDNIEKISKAISGQTNP